MYQVAGNGSRSWPHAAGSAGASRHSGLHAVAYLLAPRQARLGQAAVGDMTVSSSKKGRGYSVSGLWRAAQNPLSAANNVCGAPINGGYNDGRQHLCRAPCRYR